MCEGRIDKPRATGCPAAEQDSVVSTWCHMHARLPEPDCGTPPAMEMSLYPRERTVQPVEHQFATGGFHGFMKVTISGSQINIGYVT
jgi:hypothetical protein